MSLFPSPVLVRLQELKLWQGNYDSLLQNRYKEGTNPSDFETIEGLSSLNSTRSTPFSSPEREKSLDWDKKTIVSSKPFEQLLEEKLALEKPVSVQAKPKRPFLKKGSGLLRYKLNEQTVGNKRGNGKRLPVAERTEYNKQYKDEHLDKEGSSRSGSSKNSSKITKMGSRQKEDTEIDFTPLKMPELMIPPKATWRTVLEEDNSNKTENITDLCNKYDDDFRIYKNKFNSQIIGKINDFNLKRLVSTSPRRSVISRKYAETITTIPECESERSDNNDQSAESELRIFEELEERVEHSSFSSSNSSILRLLSSTPNKAKNNIIPQVPYLEEHKNDEQIPSGYHIQGTQNALIQKKLKEVNQRTDVLHDFLKNLKNIGNNERSSSNSSESVQERSPETSFSDEEKWSSHTDTEESRPSSTFTDTIRNNSVLKMDASVNTSFTEKDRCLQPDEKCKNCEELMAKLEKVSKQLPDIQAEKARVCDFAKELEAKREQLFRDMEAMKRKHEDIVSDLKEEFDSERRKFAREKLVFDMYIKESQNRPTKKEREEISQLKKELADAKELMKLKDSKSGSTQARLRTQVKQLEKENAELKQEAEKLQKDNAKLNATQLLRRPSEVKMLHEINKNLTKLTEETLKKQQQTRTDTSCVTASPRELKQSDSRRSKPVDENSEQEKTPRGKKTPSSKPKIFESSSQSSNTDDTSLKFELTTFADIYLEKQYETAFAQGCIVNDNILDDSRKDRNETVYEDGSKEIKYSNGNTKTISPDGNMVVVRYYNGDIKETNIMDNTLKYYYAESATWHMHYGDGSEMLEYPNGQREKLYADGRKEVHCVDGSVLFVNPEGTEEIIYPDGSKFMKHSNGEKILVLPNGQKEIHTRDHKRREYPDGTVKILYLDGTQETRYASGRIRIKDANGVLIMDTVQEI